MKRHRTVTGASSQAGRELSTDLASVSRMPARPHRTVDRVVEILETVSLSSRGVTLAELATALGAAKSSVQELTNGLLARGYLIEDERRFHLGPGPFILASRANKLAALSLDHKFVVEVAELLDCAVLVGVRVGDAIVFTDVVGEESPSLTFVARTHARRPLYTSAAGKTLLANVPDDEMHRLLDLAGPDQAGEVRQFLSELPEIRSRRLAFNRGTTLADAYAAATPLLAADGSMIATISAAVDATEAHRLDEIGEELKKAVAAVGGKYGLKPR
jgi:DNA-binding IclR family transcriptional regulator